MYEGKLKHVCNGLGYHVEMLRCSARVLVLCMDVEWQQGEGKLAAPLAYFGTRDVSYRIHA